MDDSGIRRSIVRNTAWNYVGFAVNLAVNLLLFPAAVSQMGDAATGVWLLIGSVSGYMGLLQLGLAPAMGQFAAAHMATRDDLALGRTVSTALVLVVGLGSLALLGLPAVPWLLEAFSIPEAIRADASIAFVLGIVGVPLQMPGHVFNAVLGASQRQDRCTQVWMVSLIGKLVGIALLLTLGYGLEAIMWLETGLILVTGLLLTVFAIRSAPQLRLSPSLVSVDTARELLGLGGWTFLNSVSSSLIEQTDRIVVGLFLAVDAITHYSAAWKLYMLVYSVTTTMVQALWPVAAGLHARGDAHGLRQLWLRMTKYNVAVTWPLAASLGFSAGPILRVWLGPSFADNYGVVMVLVASFVVTAHNHTAFALLGGMRRIAPVVRRYSIPQAILNLLLSLWLVHPLGMLGVALGTLLPVLLLQYTFMAFILKELDLGWREVWSAVVRPTALPALVAFTPCLAVWVWLGPQSFWLVPTAAAGSALYAAIFWSGMHPKERADLLSHVPGPLRAVLAA